MIGINNKIGVVQPTILLTISKSVPFLINSSVSINVRAKNVVSRLEAIKIM